MAKLFHPLWAKNNGEIGGPVYQDWFAELQQFGSQGVLRGIRAVKTSGSTYAPNLNKFVGFCIEGRTETARPGDSFSEKLHKGRLKPTPDGVPLVWTVGTYSVSDLLASGTQQDAEMAEQLQRGEGRTHWQHQSLAPDAA